MVFLTSDWSRKSHIVLKSSRFSNIEHCSEWIWTDFTHEQHQLTTPRLVGTTLARTLRGPYKVSVSTACQKKTRLFYSWIREGARWGESCVLIGYLSECPLGISSVCSARKSSLFGHIMNPLMTKLVPSRWLYIGLVLFWVFIDREEVKIKK